MQDFRVGQKVFVNSGANIDCSGIGVIVKVDKEYCYQPCIRVRFKETGDAAWVYKMPTRDFNVQILGDDAE